MGAFFELGALQALTESVEGLDLTQLHAYVGVSSGSLLAACLANGLTPVDMGRLVIANETGEFPAGPGMFLHPAYGEFASRALIEASGPTLAAFGVTEVPRFWLEMSARNSAHHS